MFAKPVRNCLLAHYNINIIIFNRFDTVRTFLGTIRTCLTQITNSFCHTDSFLLIGKSYQIMSDGSIAQIPVKKRNTILAYIEQWNKKQER